MSFDAEKLYGLLPAAYRIRDAEQGEPLRALLSIVAGQAGVLEEDFAQLYDDQFIETCAAWVIPYIGDLVGYRALYGVTKQVGNPRAEVANTISYRRRKGTASMLEQLARDVTGWPARVVEFFQLLATTQYMNHLRPENFYAPDLRNGQRLQHLNTPFDTIAHTLDVRRVARRRGRYNIPNVGLFLWRLRPYPITRGTARRIAEGCYTFHPLGLDAPLFNPTQTEDEISHIAETVNVPEPLRRRPLYFELEAQRQAIADGHSPAFAVEQSAYFGKSPVLRIFKVSGAIVEIPSPEILICDLSDPPAPLPETWRRPPSSKTYNQGEPAQNTLPITVAVDPVLGRMAFPLGTTLTNTIIEVNYSYGFSADIGGGQYARPEFPPPSPGATVSRNGQTLAAALAAVVPSQEHVIEIDNSSTIEGDVTITLVPGQRLTIGAKDEARPVINGAIIINAADDAELTLDGLLIAKHIEIKDNDPMTLTLRDCTVRPWVELQNGQPKPLVTPSISWQTAAAGRHLVLDNTITGSLVVATGVRVEIFDSIVDGLQDAANALVGIEEPTLEVGELTIYRSTVIGKIRAREIVHIENSLLTGTVNSGRRQKGCVRFSYLPTDSKTPRRYYCQPEMAIRLAVGDAKKKNPAFSVSQENQLTTEVRSRVRPTFTGHYYSQPAYAQLHSSTPVEIRGGADDGSEMGVFHHLYQLRRETNLRERLDEYLRFGLEAGIFYVT
jgi:hypothetical protein